MENMSFISDAVDDLNKSPISVFISSDNQGSAIQINQTLNIANTVGGNTFYCLLLSMSFFLLQLSS